MKKAVLITLLLFIANYFCGQSEVFLFYQNIFTHGANDFKAFKIDGETYLAVANFQDNNSTEIASIIYRWENLEFIPFQEIATMGASDWAFFDIDDNHYLAVANYQNDVSNEVNSVIYQWNGNQFVFYQNIPTIGAYDWEFFEIDDIPYLIVANQNNGENNYINSVLYQWDGTFFQEFQSIPCLGATDWKSFIINNETYLAIANVLDFSTRVYRWNGTEFVLFQNLLYTLATTGVESFTIDEKQFLAMSSGTGPNDLASTSKIYVWQDSIFTEFQDIETHGAFDWEYFEMNDEHYLVVANYKEAEEDYLQNSEIFKWNGTEFESFQAIETKGAVDWEYFEIENDHFLAVAEYKNFSSRGFHNINSRIFRFEEDANVFVAESPFGEAFNIFPNPSEDLVNITTPSDHSLVQIKIYTLEGKLILKSNSTPIKITSLNQGQYLLKIVTNKVTSIHKLIIQ